MAWGFAQVSGRSGNRQSDPKVVVLARSLNLVCLQTPEEKRMARLSTMLVPGLLMGLLLGLPVVRSDSRGADGGAADDPDGTKWMAEELKAENQEEDDMLLLQGLCKTYDDALERNPHIKYTTQRHSVDSKKACDAYRKMYTADKGPPVVTVENKDILVRPVPLPTGTPTAAPSTAPTFAAGDAKRDLDALTATTDAINAETDEAKERKATMLAADETAIASQIKKQVDADQGTNNAADASKVIKRLAKEETKAKQELNDLTGVISNSKSDSSDEKAADESAINTKLALALAAHRKRMSGKEFEGDEGTKNAALASLKKFSSRHISVEGENGKGKQKELEESHEDSSSSQQGWWASLGARLFYMSQ